MEINAMQTLSEYIHVYKKMISKKENVKSGNTFKIALLSSSTITGLKEVLAVNCVESDICAEFYEAPYNQYVQEILNLKSTFNQFGPSCTILIIDIVKVLGDNYFFPYRLTSKERELLAEEKCKELFNLINALLINTTGYVLVNNFDVPCYSPLGILEQRQQFGFFEMVNTMNRKLSVQFQNNNRVFIFDFDRFCAMRGKTQIMDTKMYYLGDVQIGFKHIPQLGKAYMAYINAMKLLTKKCLILDLDNTLWGGVIGEDGIEGIRLGPTPEGRPFWEFQKFILHLFDRGVILAINSNNNPEDVEKVFLEHPYMVLKKEHFAAMQINWDNKVSNMQMIAKKLNIGLDSCVFVDDLQANREVIKKALPQVVVPDMPQDPSEYTKVLMEWNYFDSLQITGEDKARNQMYAANEKREQLKNQTTNIEQYLKDLETVVTFKKADAFSIPRIAQLTQKTNQFNMTTKRYLEEEVRGFAENPNYLVLSIKAEDKFGDNGIVGVIIIKKNQKKWFIDTFLLSCRVIGRQIEQTMFAFLLMRAKEEDVSQIVGEFIPTHKNTPAKDFYKINHFTLTNSSAHSETWKYDITQNFNKPNFIKVIWNG